MKIEIDNWENSITNKDTGEVLIKIGQGGFYENLGNALEFNSILRKFMTPSQEYSHAGDSRVFTLSKKAEKKLMDAIQEWNSDQRENKKKRG